ncbi:BZ3500_MvSof-1268-A1-R1_Chr3-3g06414 [Microbotryum saponariae]|uniref:BZ3500_MvSof-1268-A1-R1_Chr3-3g06414 protein n=1 Tax=Microbotryum saponariae TaxID=289078 RepID=A0A2X0MZT3_9BASI|nr:BZ3500_MvSof-1268-A1-R1_Chr3-3g06414 [Microbotryum saponariae]SDA04381.1 BZ3501_MvSof-1269-A2-R1_Chr3-2g06101 [Microbotryum saponariae]
MGRHLSSSARLGLPPQNETQKLTASSSTDMGSTSVNEAVFGLKMRVFPRVNSC